MGCAGAGTEYTPEPSASRTPHAPGDGDIASDAERETSLASVGRSASYRLSVRLAEKEHRLEGEGTIEFRNHSTRALEELYFHLYLNAFKDDRALFSRSRFRTGRSGNTPSQWGHIEVTSLKAQGADLWATRVFVEPNDETDVRVSLAHPLEPGASLTLDLAFTAQLPSIVERTGFSGDFHLVAQWFPKLARLEPDGQWAHFPFHPQAEFYADFGDYDVSLDVPRDFVVGATGTRVEAGERDARQQLRYRALAVHDFAWTAWPDWQVREERIEGVDVRLLFPPGHEHNAERTLAAVRFGLPHYSERYGRYPYPTLTIAHPPRHARHAGGMEYPTFITTGGSWYSGRLSRAVELITLHELAHQWFYGMVASDETRFPFLDEGLASYAELVAARSWLGETGAADLLGIELSVHALHRTAAARVAGAQAIALPAADFASFRELSGLVYSRSATLFTTLEGVYGANEVQAALGRYAREQRFRHPSPAALLVAIEAELGHDARAQVELALLQKARIDYSVSDLDTVYVPERGTKPFDNRVMVFRHGELSFPVDIRIGYRDGSITNHQWDGRGDWFEVVTTSHAEAVSAEIDPDRRVLLDDNLLNNAVSLEPAGSARTLAGLTYAAELVARWLGP